MRDAVLRPRRSALERASGKNLKAFFERWVYEAGHPIYKITWEPVGRGRTRLTLGQEQPGEAFTDPITVELKGATARRFVIRPAGKVSVIVVRSGRTKGVVVDPDEIILKEMVNERRLIGRRNRRFRFEGPPCALVIITIYYSLIL